MGEIQKEIFEEKKDFTKKLIGHSNTVSGLDLIYDNSLLISSSFDTTSISNCVNWFALISVQLLPKTAKRLTIQQND